MSFTETKRREIRKYLLRKIDEDDPLLIGKVSDAFGISPTSVRRYLTTETGAGHIESSKENACGYQLKTTCISHSYKLSELSEFDDDLAFEDASFVLPESREALRIWEYGLTEIFNNAISHSGGSKSKVFIEKNHLYTSVSISDDGVGIFTNIVDAMKRSGINNPQIRDAIVELYKGKFTSMPGKHSGEGIFFTMQLFDKMAIISDGNILRRGYEGSPSIIKSHLISYAQKISKTGTVVIMKLENDTAKNITEILNRFSNTDEGFTKTRIPVLEACLDREPVSRSQARRICTRLEKFK